MEHVEGLLVVAFVAGFILGWLLRGGRGARLENAPARPAMPKIAHADALQDAQLQQALRAGNKIEAIKRYRELTGSQLKDAKDAIDALG